METTGSHLADPGREREGAAPGPEDRRLRIPGAFNVRDLGGLPARGGAVVRSGRLLRAGELSGLEPAGAAALAAYGLRTVVDLRTRDEIAARPDSLDGTGAVLHAIPLIALPYSGIPARAVDLYTYLAESCTAETAQVVKTLAAPGALPGLFHCAVGKDRTGFVAAVLLAVLGVPDDEIVADFIASNPELGLPAIPGVTSAAARAVQATMPVYDMLLSARNAVRADLLADALDRVRTRHGSVAGFLRAGGVTDPELESLKAALIDHP